MFQRCNFWIIVASIGHAMLFGLALSGAARMISAACGQPISSQTANNIFFVTSLVLAPPAAYFKVAALVWPKTTVRQT